MQLNNSLISSIADSDASAAANVPQDLPKQTIIQDSSNQGSRRMKASLNLTVDDMSSPRHEPARHYLKNRLNQSQNLMLL